MAPTTLPDEDIVARVLAGETGLFEILMRRHNEQLYRAARAILRDEREAEDVMQEAYVGLATATARSSCCDRCKGSVPLKQQRSLA